MPPEIIGARQQLASADAATIFRMYEFIMTSQAIRGRETFFPKAAWDKADIWLGVSQLMFSIPVSEYIPLPSGKLGQYLPHVCASV